MLVVTKIPRYLGVLTLSMATLGAVSCGSAPEESGIRKAPAPYYLGSADAASDASDNSCRVVLRSVSRVKKGPGYLTTCDKTPGTSSGPCRYVWRGTLSVAANVAQAFSVEVLFSTNETQGSWYTVQARRASASTGGYIDYTFDIDSYTPAAGMSMTSLMRTEVNLIPYLRGASGGRIFDHNRVKDPFGNYALDAQNGWAMANDTSACPASAPSTTPVYELSYPAFTETLHDGPVRAGERLEVRYDSRRLRETQRCMGSHGAARATTIRMGWRINDDASTNKVQDLEQYVESSLGCPNPPCISASPRNPMIQVPANAESLQLWFYCVPGYDQGAQSNWKYDSNFGKNYRLPVSGGQAHEAVDWAGAWALHAGRSGFVYELPEPYTYTGYTNMGYSIQAEVYVKGLTNQPGPVDRTQLKAYVESDLASCKPGGALKRVEIPIAKEHVGVFGNNVLVRWAVEASLLHCANGTYRYRFLFSADGGKSTTPLGNDVNSLGANAADFRRIVNNK